MDDISHGCPVDMLNYESLCKISTKECCPITEPYFPQPLFRISSAEAGVLCCAFPEAGALPPPPPLLLSSSVQVHIKLFKEICKLEVKRYRYHQRYQNLYHLSNNKLKLGKLGELGPMCACNSSQKSMSKLDCSAFL